MKFSKSYNPPIIVDYYKIKDLFCKDFCVSPVFVFLSLLFFYLKSLWSISISISST